MIIKDTMVTSIHPPVHSHSSPLTYRSYRTPNIEIRHTCEDSDSLTSYTYTQHDGRGYAAQTLIDGGMNVVVNTTWVKSDDGMQWGVRVEGDAIDQRESGWV